MLVKQILQAKGDQAVITVPRGTSVKAAADLLAARRIGGLIVSDGDGHVDGILSERDIVRALAAREGACLTETIDMIMTPDPVCCSPQDSSDAVLAQMTDGRFRHMPVMEAGMLVGIVTIGDVVKARMDELAMEKTALEGMIMGY